MNDKQTSIKAGEIPQWSIDLVNSVVTYMKEIDEFRRICTTAMQTTAALPGLFQSYIDTTAIPEKDRENARKSLEQATRHAKRANKEIEEEYAVLNAQTIILQWGVLEDYVKTLLAQLLYNEPRAQKAEKIQKLKVTFGEYNSLEPEEKATYIIDLLEKELHGETKQGINRFEELLNVFELSGSVEQETRYLIFELQQVRNVIVHRNGIADRKLVAACPRLKLKVGSPVKVTEQSYNQYQNAIINYLIELAYRIGAYYGKPLRPTKS